MADLKFRLRTLPYGALTPNLTADLRICPVEKALIADYNFAPARVNTLIVHGLLAFDIANFAHVIASIYFFD